MEEINIIRPRNEEKEEEYRSPIGSPRMETIDIIRPRDTTNSRGIETIDIIRPRSGGVATEAPTPQVSPAVEQEPSSLGVEGQYAEKYSGMDYSEDDLTQDQFYAPIERYMTARYGSHLADRDKYSRRDVVERYLNNMRGFAAGNTVRAVNEITYLYSVEDKNDLEAIAEGYAIYENLPNIFSGKVSAFEALEGIQDYVRATIMDPSNLIGGILGWVAGGAGTKAATTVARQAARKTAADMMKKGATKAAANEAAKKTFGQQLVKAQVEVGASLAKRRAGTKAVKTVAEKLTTKRALANVMTTTAYDMAINVGTDWMYQTAMMDTGNQEEFSMFQSGAAAAGAFLMGGLQAGSVALRGTNAGALTHEALDATRDPAKVWEGLTESMRKLSTETSDSWDAKVLKGKKLDEIPQSFWIRFLAGDDQLDTDGIIHQLLKEGYGYQSRFDGDKASNWIADWIKANPENQSVDFIKKFNEIFGSEIGTDIKSVENFADAFAAEMSGSGRIMQAVGRFSKGDKLPDDVTVTQYLSDAFGIKESPVTRSEKLARRGEDFSQGFAKFQATTIRAIVANLGTTWLNVGGYSSATILNSASDLAMGAGYYLGGKGKRLMGYEDTTDLVKRGAQLWRVNGKRIFNLLDPVSTIEDYKSIVTAFPEQMRELDYTLAGGIDRFSKQLDVDLQAGRINRGYEYIIDKASVGNMVYAQDVITKSQEFMYQVDKAARLKFGKSYQEVIQDPQFGRIISKSDEFKEVVGKAAYETNRAIFSQTMRSERGVGEIAGMLEDFRRLPGIGITIPFGRFFNNTVAFMSDHSGISVFAKHMGMDVQRGTDELISRAAVTYGIIATMAMRENDFIEKGFDWYEGEDVLGMSASVQDQKYNFPWSALKAASRIFAIHMRGETPSKDLVEDITNNVFGQLTRDLTDAEEGLVDTLRSMLDGSFFEDWNSLEAGQVLAAKWGSAMTRFAEPVNEVIGIARGYDYKNMDRKQGVEHINNGLRYIDQVLDMVGIIDAKQKYGVSQGAVPSNRGKLVSPIRETLGQTDTEKMFNRVGISDWKKNMYSESGEASNRYNEVMNRAVEEYASHLIKQPDWNTMDEDARLTRVRAVVTKAAAMTKQLMKTNVLQTGDRSLELILRMSAQGATKLNKAIKELEEETGKTYTLEDMSYEELLSLSEYMNTMEDINKLKTRHWIK